MSEFITREDIEKIIVAEMKKYKDKFYEEWNEKTTKATDEMFERVIKPIKLENIRLQQENEKLQDSWDRDVAKLLKDNGLLLCINDKLRRALEFYAGYNEDNGQIARQALGENRIKR